MSEKKSNILITCAGRRVELVQAFKEARSSLGFDGKIVLADAIETAPSLAFADVSYITPRIDSGLFVQSIIDIANKEDVSLIIPTIDTGLLLLSENRELIEQSTKARVLISNPSVIKTCRDKHATAAFFKENGFALPKTYEVSQLESLANLPLPLFIKPKDGSSSINAFKISTKEDFDFFKNYVKNPIVQEFIGGQEYSIDAFTDFDGNVVSIVPRKRLAVRAGEILNGQIDLNEYIISDVKRLISLLGPVGPVTIQGFLGDDGVFRYTEINPRFGGGAPMSFKAGANSPYMIYLLLNGSPLPKQTIKDKLLFSRFDQTIEV